MSQHCGECEKTVSDKDITDCSDQFCPKKYTKLDAAIDVVDVVTFPSLPRTGIIDTARDALGGAISDLFD